MKEQTVTWPLTDSQYHDRQIASRRVTVTPRECDCEWCTGEGQLLLPFPSTRVGPRYTGESVESK